MINAKVLLKLFLTSLILAGVLLSYVIMSSHTIHLVGPKKPTQTPWPTCLTVPSYRIRCDPLTDPFATTTTWHRAPHPDKRSPY